MKKINFNINVNQSLVIPIFTNSLIICYLFKQTQRYCIININHKIIIKQIFRKDLTYLWFQHLTLVLFNYKFRFTNTLINYSIHNVENYSLSFCHQLFKFLNILKLTKKNCETIILTAYYTNIPIPVWLYSKIGKHRIKSSIY